MGLWVIAGSWSGDQLTDGFIPKHMLDVLGGKPSDATALVAAGLWEECPGGWVFHCWQDQNPTRSEVDEVREKERQKKAAWRAKKAEKRLEEES